MTKPTIAINKIRIDAGTQFRAAINQDRVTEYAELFDSSNEWPFDSACEVYFDGLEYFLVDGFHRYHACKRVKRASLSCIVHSGTQRDAIKFALSANARHGLHRSNEDKRKAVAFVLEDAEWSKLSSRAIAEICGVSDRFVGSMRNESTANGSQSDEKRLGKDGRTTSPPKPKADSKPEPKDEPDEDDAPSYAQTQVQSVQSVRKVNPEDDDDTPSYAQTQDHWEDVEPDLEHFSDTPTETPQALAAPIQAVATQLNGMLKELKRLADHTGGEWLDLTDLETQINLLKHSIRQSVYWRDCMDCEGKGCKTCRKLGWLSLDRKKYLTQEQKDKVGA
jgi:ParB-like chromosome segregation protein Spo0J